MKGDICGHCENWRCDDPLHLIGHCMLNRMDIPHGTMAYTCMEYKPRYTINFGEQEPKDNE